MAAEAKRMARDDDLPHELWREILTRVPVKSILRCRSVSKSWYSLVSCPDFISHYTSRNLNKNCLLLQLDDYKRAQIWSLTSHDESLTEFREHKDFPEAFLGSEVKIVGSCNGLICLSKEKSYDDVEVITFVIWNPTINKVVELPSRTIASAAGCFSYYGFGFDFKTGDYKVMCMRYVCSDRNNVCGIFDLRKGVWRGIGPFMDSWHVRGCTPECYLNGAVHWTRCRYIRGKGYDRILLSFDMSDEVFREISMPDCAEFVWSGDDDDDDDYSVETRSVTLRRLIHVIVWKQESNDYSDVYEDCSVWAMKEYGLPESWTKLFSLDLKNPEVYRRVQPNEFFLWKNGEVLMLRDPPEDEYHYNRWDSDEDMESGDEQELLLYNNEGKTYKQLFSFAKCISDMCLYEESLVLM